MLWVYVLLLTVGVVAIVPAVLRAIDGQPSAVTMGFAGFAGLFGGATGLVARQATSNGVAAFIAAAAIGLAAGALHPEVLAALGGQKKPELTHDEP